MNKKSELNPYSIEDQFNLYLRLAGLTGDMPLVQYKELKRAFFAAWGMLMVVYTEEMPKIDEEEEIIRKTDSMIRQVGQFMKDEAENETLSAGIRDLIKANQNMN